MGKPRKRKALADRDLNANAGGDGDAREVELVEDQSIHLLCNAIDQEVKSRAAAIRAICDAQVSSALTQLKLLESTFSEDMLNMPMDLYVRQCCPNSKLLQRAHGIVELCKSNSQEQEPHFDCVPPNASNSVRELFLQSSAKIFALGETPMTRDTVLTRTRTKVGSLLQTTKRVTRSSMKTTMLRTIR